MIGLVNNAPSRFPVSGRSTRLLLLLLSFAILSSCCFGQPPADLSLPNGTIDSGSQVFQATNSITNNGIFVVENSASVALAAGSYIRLEPGFDAKAGNASFTLFATIDPNVANWPPNGGYDPPNIPGSYTAPDYAPDCDDISGQWIESDNVGNSVERDLNQSGSSIIGTLSFYDYRDFGYGPTYCGLISYSASGTANGSSYSLSATNPMPSVDSCGLPLAASETGTVSLSGRACGSGVGAYTISGGGGGGPQFRFRVSPQAALAHPLAAKAANAAPRPATTSGNSTWTTYSPRFNVSYASYIPVDNIPGPTPCYTEDSGIPARTLLRYKGDANRGTYRTTQAIFVVPDKQVSNNFFANTGATRNYGAGSPANGSTLDSNAATPDIYDGPYTGADEDNTPYDCRLWNEKGQADTAQMQSHSVSFSGHQAVVTLSGLGQDPLEPKLGGIKWNASISLDETNPSAPTAQFSITHTCYPAHIIKVNGVTIKDIPPRYNNTFYLIGCLTSPVQVTDTSDAVQIPTH